MKQMFATSKNRLIIVTIDFLVSHTHIGYKMRGGVVEDVGLSRHLYPRFLLSDFCVCSLKGHLYTLNFPPTVEYHTIVVLTFSGHYVIMV